MIVSSARAVAGSDEGRAAGFVPRAVGRGAEAESAPRLGEARKGAGRVGREFKDEHEQRHGPGRAKGSGDRCMI